MIDKQEVKGTISQEIGPFYCYGSPGGTLSKTISRIIWDFYCVSLRKTIHRGDYCF
jgi:hypothetical protein